MDLAPMGRSQKVYSPELKKTEAPNRQKGQETLAARMMREQRVKKTNTANGATAIRSTATKTSDKRAEKAVNLKVAGDVKRSLEVRRRPPQEMPDVIEPRKKELIKSDKDKLNECLDKHKQLKADYRNASSPGVKKFLKEKIEENGNLILQHQLTIGKKELSVKEKQYNVAYRDVYQANQLVLAARKEATDLVKSGQQGLLVENYPKLVAAKAQFASAQNALVKPEAEYALQKVKVQNTEKKLNKTWTESWGDAVAKEVHENKRILLNLPQDQAEINKILKRKNEFHQTCWELESSEKEYLQHVGELRDFLKLVMTTNPKVEKQFTRVNDLLYAHSVQSELVLKGLSDKSTRMKTEDILDFYANIWGKPIQTMVAYSPHYKILQNNLMPVRENLKKYFPKDSIEQLTQKQNIIDNFPIAPIQRSMRYPMLLEALTKSASPSTVADFKEELAKIIPKTIDVNTAQEKSWI